MIQHAKSILRTLTTNVHILVISLLVAALGLGMVASPRTAESSGKGAKKTQNLVELSTSPSTGDNSAAQSTSIWTYGNVSGASYGGQNQAGQNVGANSINSAVTINPPTSGCTPCTAGDYCADTCVGPTPTPPIPVPTPTPAPIPTPTPTPTPPVTGGCGVCGGGGYHAGVMCPMYCTQATAAGKAD